jgi:hypothetical protein
MTEQGEKTAFRVETPTVLYLKPLKEMPVIELSNQEYAALVGERDALTVKTTSLESALKRAHDLILHIEDVLPDESFDLIDTTCWNAATSDMREVPAFHTDELNRHDACSTR